MNEVQLARDSRPDPPRFVFGAVVYDVLPAPDLVWELDEEHRLLSTPTWDAPTLASVECVISRAPELERVGAERTVVWSWDADRDEAQLSTARVRVRVRRLGPRRYVATAAVVPSSAGCSSLLTALSGLIAFREGGLVLHAAGIELEGRGLLFIGPSGAGKTTSSNLCRGARWFARDRAIVYPAQGRWWTSGLCGGDDIHLPRSPLPILPLAGVLRVARGADAPPIARVDAAQALFDVRQSVQGGGDVQDEALHLENAHALIAAVGIGRASPVLGRPLTALLRSWLGDHE